MNHVKTAKSGFALVTALGLSLMLSACGGNEGQTPQTTPMDSAPPASTMDQDPPAGSMQEDVPMQQDAPMSAPQDDAAGTGSGDGQ